MDWEKATPVIAVFGIIAVLLVVTQMGLFQASGVTNTEVIDEYGDSVFIAQRTGINLVSGTNVTISGVDNPTDNRVDFTIAATGVGSEVVFRARKDSAGTITKGSAVHLTGFNPSGFIEVEEADADDPAKMPAIGLAETDLTNSSTGAVILIGELTSLDTTGFAFGNDLYVSTTPGLLTAIKPTGNSAQIQKVAEVSRVHISQGVIEVFGAGRANDVPNITDDNLWLGSATDAATQTAVGDCDDSGGNHLNYDTTTNMFSCGTTNNPVASFTSGTIDSVVITGGTIDGTTIGGSTPANGTFIDVSVGDDILLTSSGAIISFNSGDVALTHSAGELNLSGGNFDLQNNDLTNIGNAATDITSTGANFYQNLTVSRAQTVDPVYLTVENTSTASGSASAFFDIQLPETSTGRMIIRFREGAADGSANNTGYELESNRTFDEFWLRSADVDGSGTFGWIFSVADGTDDIEFYGDVTPNSDGSGNLGTVALTWADMNSVLINGSDINLENDWSMLELEDYPGYPSGWALTHRQDWRTAEVLKVSEPGSGSRLFSEEAKPVFAVTDDFIEYQGRRITPEILDRLLELVDQMEE